MKYNLIKHFTLLITNTFFCLVIQAQSFYVSPNGNDKNIGSVEKPFATLNHAKEVVANLLKKDRSNQGRITVWIRGGNYTLTSPLLLGNEDGGDKNQPVVYKAYPKENPVLVGGVLVDKTLWQPLDASARSRVSPNVDANKIVALDVEKLHLTHVQRFAPTNQFTTDWFIIDMFANGQRQPISQWPNQDAAISKKDDAGWTTCNGSKDFNAFYYGNGGSPEDHDTTNEIDMDGSHRAERWKKSLESGHELWLKGLWRTPWEPRTHKVSEINTTEQYIRLVDAPPNGMGSKYSKQVSTSPEYRAGSGKENWFAINSLDEIDKPGEWALDIKDKKIYYYPPSPISKLEVMISDMGNPVIQCNNTQNVRFEGITITGGLGNGIELNHSNNITVEGCTIKNVGKSGVLINNGFQDSLLSCDIYETAGFGVELNGNGDRKLLKSSEIVVDNNHIHHVGRLAFKEAMYIKNSVGVLVSHNLLHDIPKAGISTYDINNCTIEYNEIHNIALKESDNGVFYNYGGWSTYGNVFRYNFSHHTNRSNGLYTDDGTSGDFYYNNIVVGCISGIVFGGGHDNIAEYNLFIDTKGQGTDDRGINRNYKLGTKYETNLTKFNINSDPWKSFGEKMMADHHLTTHLWSDILTQDWHPEFPNGCRMDNNIAVATGPFRKPKNGNVSAQGNLELKTIAEANFYDYPNLDLRTKNTAILEKFPDLNEAFPKIGLYKNNYRKTLPTERETGGLWNRGAAGDPSNEDQMIDKK